MAKYDTLDHWSLKAQKEGYPARSVYKLQEMNERFSLLKTRSDFRALDLGAAPGSWSLFVLRKLNRQGFLAAADLSALSRQYDKGLFDAENFFFVQGDLCDADIRAQLEEKGPYDLLISDAAPATSGNRTVDTLRSAGLVEMVIDYAASCVKPGGAMVAKVFQGSETKELMDKMRALFAQVRSFKPKSCRQESFETFLIGQGRKA